MVEKASFTETKPFIYLHVVEGSPLELVELLLLESSLSGGCSEHIGVGQAGKAPDIKSVFSKAIEFLRFVRWSSFLYLASVENIQNMNTHKHIYVCMYVYIQNYKNTKHKNGRLTCTCSWPRLH